MKNVVRMEIGTVKSRDQTGLMQVQLETRVVHAKLMQGEAVRGDEIEGFMEPGLCSWMSKARRRLVVYVIAQQDRPLASALSAGVRSGDLELRLLESLCTVDARWFSYGRQCG